MAKNITIVTYDWVPEFPRGFVRDIRVRWAANEARIAYDVETVPFKEKSGLHREMQPFEQVPILKAGNLSLFESGAILLYLAEKTEALMPRDEEGRAETIQWVIAALNSVEPFTVNWLVAKVFLQNEEQASAAAGLMNQRLASLARVLEGREFIAAGCFTVADIITADVLRVIARQSVLDDFPSLARYVERLTARPAFLAAYDAQMAHWKAADATQQAPEPS